MSSPNPTRDYEKQVAVILPKWCLNMIVDHLDMEYESLTQEQDFHFKTGDDTSMKLTKEEIDRIESAIIQINSYLENM